MIKIKCLDVPVLEVKFFKPSKFPTMFRLQKLIRNIQLLKLCIPYLLFNICRYRTLYSKLTENSQEEAAEENSSQAAAAASDNEVGCWIKRFMQLKKLSLQQMNNDIILLQ